MSRPFRVKEAKKLINEHRNLLEKLEAVQSTHQAHHEKVKKCSDLLIAQNVLKILEDIPVEEINNHAKRSFRVKTLRDNGYHTIADIAPASVYSLSSIHGISEDAAYSIKRIADEMATHARTGCKIRLSTDNKTKEASELIQSIYRLKQYRPLANSVQQLIENNRSDILTAIAYLEAANGTIKWFFVSKEKKQKAMEAFCHLTELQINEYGTESASLLSELQGNQDCSIDDAWNDFKLLVYLN